MKYKKYLLILCLIAIVQNLSAQNNVTIEKIKKEKVQFSALVQGGWLEGEKGSSGQVKFIPTLIYKTWQVGIGTGLDHYYLRSVPLFLDVRKYIFNKVPLFGYADVGISFPWIKEEEGFGVPNTYKNGLYYDLGIGYRFPSKKRTGFLLSAGYAEKRLSVINKVVNPCFYPPCPEYSNTYDFELRRFSFKAGLQF
jgi:hypothetical protein